MIEPLKMRGARCNKCRLPIVGLENPTKRGRLVWWHSGPAKVEDHPPVVPKDAGLPGGQSFLTWPDRTNTPETTDGA